MKKLINTSDEGILSTARLKGDKYINHRTPKPKENNPYDTRLTRYAAVSTAVTLLSDEQLRERVKDATVLNTGIGGTTALMQIEETPIFVKIIPLTEKERLTENATHLLR